MADYKSGYSQASSAYVNTVVPSNKIDKERYKRAKEREALYNNNWIKQKVNINEIVKKFAPNSIGKVCGMKYKFFGDRYNVIADMSAGYLRIYDKKLKRWVKLDGTIGNAEETHFKIKRREEM